MSFDAGDPAAPAPKQFAIGQIYVLNGVPFRVRKIVPRGGRVHRLELQVPQEAKRQPIRNPPPPVHFGDVRPLMKKAVD